MRIGVLALQGDFAEHIVMLRRLGVQGVEVRLPDHLVDVDGLIIPGGESTTIGKLATRWGLMDPLREFGRAKPIWGTCAGAIFLSKEAHRDQPPLGLMDITVERNVLTVAAERSWQRQETDQPYFGERYRGSFRRQIQLGDGLDLEHLEADLHDGVLAIRIPVAEQAKPRKIAVGEGRLRAPEAIETSTADVA